MHSFSGLAAWLSLCALRTARPAELACPETVLCVIRVTAGCCLFYKLRNILRRRVQGFGASEKPALGPVLAENGPEGPGRASPPWWGLGQRPNVLFVTLKDIPSRLLPPPFLSVLLKKRSFCDSIQKRKTREKTSESRERFLDFPPGCIIIDCVCFANRK